MPVEALRRIGLDMPLIVEETRAPEMGQAIRRVAIQRFVAFLPCHNAPGPHCLRIFRLTTPNPPCLACLSVERAFAARGRALSRTETDFRPRPGQLRMALAVARTVEQGAVLVVEAGTGVGKPFPLVPALLGGESGDAFYGHRGTCKTSYLCARSAAPGAGPGPARCGTALLKGWQLPVSAPLGTGAPGSAAHDGSVAQTLARIEQWAQTTRSGDLAELPALDERSAAIPLATSTRENCLGSQCPQFRQCHVLQARREALKPTSW